MRIGTLDIETFDTNDKEDDWAQAKYLVHGFDDVLWTDNISAAVDYLKESLIDMRQKVRNIGV